MRYLMIAIFAVMCAFGVHLESAQADASAIPFRTDKKVSVGCGVGMLDSPVVEGDHRHLDYKPEAPQSPYNSWTKRHGHTMTDGTTPYLIDEKKSSPIWWLLSCGVNSNITTNFSVRGIVDLNSETNDPGFKLGAAWSW